MTNDLALQRVFEVLHEVKNDLVAIWDADETKTLSEARNKAENGMIKILRFYNEVEQGAAEHEAKKSAKQ